MEGKGGCRTKIGTNSVERDSAPSSVVCVVMPAMLAVKDIVVVAPCVVVQVVNIAKRVVDVPCVVVVKRVVVQVVGIVEGVAV